MILTPRDEEILKAVWYYRYITARDLNNLFFAKTSITHTREILATLSGADLQANNYLCRFPLVSLICHLKNNQVSRIVSFGRVRPLLPRSVARDRREARVGTSLPTKPVQLSGPPEPVSCKVGRHDRSQAHAIFSIVCWH